MIPILRYPGGKAVLADWVIDSFPKKYGIYLEPFFGAGSVFFAKERVQRETVNDVDGQVANFFRVCRDHPGELERAVAMTPYARDEYVSILPGTGHRMPLTEDAVEDARRFAIRCWMGYGPKLSADTGWRTAISLRAPSGCAAWTSLPDRIAFAGIRLTGVQIENMDALKLIGRYKDPDCFVYADPPYLLSKRRDRLYMDEMGDEESHRELLRVLLEHPGPVMISGYGNSLYDETLSGWSKKEIASHTASHAEKVETIWCNYRI